MSAPGADRQFDVRTISALVWSHRLFVALVVGVCTGGFAAYAFLSTPVYRSSVVLMPSTADKNSLAGSLNSVLGQAGGLVSLLGVGGGTVDASTEEALAVLRSRDFTERFIADHQLLPKLFPDRWDAANQRWKASAKVPTPARGFKLFDKQIRIVDQDKKSGLVILQIDWRDRIEGSDWANELVSRLNAEMRQRAIAKADASVNFLEREIPKTTVLETRDAVNRLIESQEKQRMIANVTTEFAFRVVDKSIPADADDPTKPKKPLLIALGFMLGLALSVGILAIRLSLARGGEAGTARRD